MLLFPIYEGDRIILTSIRRISNILVDTLPTNGISKVKYTKHFYDDSPRREEMLKNKLWMSLIGVESDITFSFTIGLEVLIP